MVSLEQQYSIALLALRGEYQAALARCNQIIDNKKEIFDIYVIKAVCLQNLGKFAECVNISDDIILLDATRYQGYYHKGIGNFSRSEFKSALIAFNQAKEKCKNIVAQNKISDWQRKSKSQIDKRYLKDFLLESVPTPNQVFTGSVSPSPVTNPNFVVSSTGKLSYTWYQTNSQVGVEIVYTLNDQSKLRTVFDERHLEVSFPIGGGRSFDLSLDLFQAITPDKSYVKVGLNKIEVHLEKKTPNLFWKLLEAQDVPQVSGTDSEIKKEEKKPAHIPVQAAAASYPTSSQQKKDWDKIDKEIEIDMHKNRDDYVQGDQSMQMFKWIYQGSDEDTRRAMMKSFQESGGQALSTDWKDVQNQDYKGKDRLSPPKGMVEKQYEM